MYSRQLIEWIDSKFGTAKVIMITGPRQAGKTTLIKSALTNKEYLFLDGDDPQDRALMTEPSTSQLKSIVGDYKYVFVDEVQRIPSIGITLKIIADQIKSTQLIVSGSSSFELTNALNEPLTGRKWEKTLLPLSYTEIENKISYSKALQQLENRLIYGFYPDVLNNPGDEAEVLENLASSYIYKDILTFSDIRKPEVLTKLVEALAYQIGSEVNYSELSNLLKIDKATVSKYIDVLSQAYIIFPLSPLAKNLRNEIKRNKKIYFYDIGIRNTVIGNYNPMNARMDKGAIWENFLIAERLKQNLYAGRRVKSYFWRTRQQQEVDYVEVSTDEVEAFEFKWNPRKKGKISKTFMNAYKAKAHHISNDNFRDFILPLI